MKKNESDNELDGILKTLNELREDSDQAATNRQLDRIFKNLSLLTKEELQQKDSEISDKHIKLRAEVPTDLIPFPSIEEQCKAIEQRNMPDMVVALTDLEKAQAKFVEAIELVTERMRSNPSFFGTPTKDFGEEFYTDEDYGDLNELYSNMSKETLIAHLDAITKNLT